ncbi:hypothetical protein XF24_00693 [candidate division SR1 bacterium Aalborg_AAW-1]|nr:hypothetical protein XF24_00693 [candidate division SR1 bacterium Aalborg_AAW-1]
MSVQPSTSVHHVTPVSNMLLGNEECNILMMNHQDHINLHRICDTQSHYQNTMSKLYGKINNDLLLSLGSVDEIYTHLGYFFENFEKLPLGVRKALGEKWKQIVMYHLNQRPQITNTDNDQYRKLHRKQIEQRGNIVSHNDIEYIMNQDKSIMKDLVLHIIRRLKKHGITDELLTLPTKTLSTENYMIPLMMRGRSDSTNQITGDKKIHTTIFNKAISDGGTRVRGPRLATNGSFIMGSEDWKRWYDVQERYLRKAKKIIDHDYGDYIWILYNKKMQQQLGTTIAQWNKLEKILSGDSFYKQGTYDVEGMHHEALLLRGKIGDRLKKLLADEYCFV